jgi:hypothetical protein
MSDTIKINKERKMPEKRATCDCMCRMENEIKNHFHPEAEYMNGQYEMLSGRGYMNFSYKIPSRKSEKTMMVLFSYCPFCGKSYQEEEAQNEQ